MIIAKKTLQLTIFRGMSSTNSKKSVQKIPTKAEVKTPIIVNKAGNVSIKILAKPGAKQNTITEINDEEIQVQIAAVAREGEANTELIKYFSKVLGLRKSDISLDRGSKSRNKILVIAKEAISVERTNELIKESCEKG